MTVVVVAFPELRLRQCCELRGSEDRLHLCFELRALLVWRGVRVAAEGCLQILDQSDLIGCQCLTCGSKICRESNKHDAIAYFRCEPLQRVVAVTLAELRSTIAAAITMPTTRLAARPLRWGKRFERCKLIGG